ncbi:MAG: prolyl oligopeptidase family serine peptidase [Planctomycetota bacterium]|nr:prolyl oligopeptidase family serine peptidase [Planctomycetota bacterium]
MAPTIRLPHLFAPVAAVALSLGPQAALGADETDAAEQKSEEAEGFEWTLESLFDEDETLMGPSARSMAFSHDGKYAAYLWRPFAERRHGNDLWIFDVEKGEAKRVTSVSVMEPFQKRAAKVAEDRLKKHDESEGKADKAKSEGSWGELEDAMKGKSPEDEIEVGRKTIVDTVGEKDADDEDAPRYGGIQGFVWAPTANEMLISSSGDIYRHVIGDDEGLVRLTRTRTAEREVQYLPDGSGYTSLVDGALVRVRFGDHLVDQLDPELPGGLTMRSYALSPDGKRIVFVASSGSIYRGGSRTVDIATYRDRFMKVRTVPRTVSDDPVAKVESAVFLHELPTGDSEVGRLIKVYERTSSGPRDVLQLPDWAPDSSSVTFSVFDQATSQVHILEADFEKDEPEEDSGSEDTESADEEGAESPADGKAEEDELPGTGELEEREARIVHRFLHTGGPNTPRMIEPRYLADSRRIALITEQTGFRHVHVLDPVYETLVPMTHGRYEVYPLGLNEARTHMFMEATKEDSACLDIYALEFDTGELARLTERRGVHSSAAVSDDGAHVLAIHAAFGSPRELVHVANAKDTTAITDSHPERTTEILAAQPELFAYENRAGQEIRGFVFTPEQFGAPKLQEGETRPLLVYVYGGPLGTRKSVVEGTVQSSAYQFAQYMTREHGWVTATIDPRGQSGYGALFEKANFEQVGKPQVEDLVDGVRYLVEAHGADADRVAIHGWSFGGFQTQMCMYTEPEVFKCGIAGAGPTEWENYNSWYSTGTIGSSREGETDLGKYSLLPLAKGLEGKLLLVHGMEDSNVLYQDTVRVYAELLDAGKEALVELFVDPTGGHGLGGHVKSLGRFRKYEEFLLRANR